MAASGYTPISLYYSTTASAVPTAGNLANGELALNIADMKLYAKNSAGTVTLLASNASTTGVDSLSFGSTGLTPSTATTGAITVAGTLNVANGGTGVTTSTGTGSVVLSNSPTLVTPALGTPSSGVVTNLTGTASININGTVGATTPTTGAFTTLTTSSTVTLNGGTANGVTYLNGSKVLTSGSALTFDGNGGLVLTYASSGTGLNAKGSATSTNVDATLSRGGILSLTNTNATDGNTNAVQFFNSNDLTSAYISGVNVSHSGRTGALVFGTANGSAPTERVRIDNTGNVGIGTTNPLQKFVVSNNGGAGLEIGPTAIASSPALVSYNRSSAAYTQLTASALLHVWQNSGTEVARIDTSGNLLVGTTTNTNTSKLVVNGTISQTVSGTQYLVVDQSDIGTGANEIPLNQYLGKMAYKDVEGLQAQLTPALTIASAATIQPLSAITFISGTTTINTITAPAEFVGGGQITLIPTGLWSTGTSGNIALATTGVVSKALIMTYDATTAKWYPSY